MRLISLLSQFMATGLGIAVFIKLYSERKFFKDGTALARMSDDLRRGVMMLAVSFIFGGVLTYTLIVGLAEWNWPFNLRNAMLAWSASYIFISFLRR